MALITVRCAGLLNRKYLKMTSDFQDFFSLERQLLKSNYNRDSNDQFLEIYYTSSLS